MAPLMAPESLWKSRENVGETESADAKQNIQSRSTNSDMKIEGAPYHRFRNVTEISSRVRAATSGPAVDMAKALKGMAPVKVQNVVDSISGALPRANNSIIQEKQPFQLIQVDKTPLDLSLKTSMRILSSKSFKWCHKVSTRNQISGLRDFISLFQSYGNSASETSTSSSDGKGMIGTNVEASFWKAFHSWVHPQAVLPPSVLSALASSAARGGVAATPLASVVIVLLL